MAESDDERLGRVRADVREQWRETLLRQIETAIPITQRVGNRLRIQTFDEEWFIEVYAASEKEVGP